MLNVRVNKNRKGRKKEGRKERRNEVSNLDVAKRFWQNPSCRHHFNQFEERKTSLREGPRTGESWGDSGGTYNQILGAKPQIFL